ncbi:hypothetical protein [Parabacteroides chongii]|uniref:hypothetical protein n=3 Tax=Parabacteroides TaxID=375288 RepID=UPI00240D680D|nr:hypothetical protein [Parabacteroides chongii]WFE87053.1 hypothetical protein P3L47_10870 [Parabacteroides chongii]
MTFNSYKTNKYEKKLDAALLTNAAQDFRNQCEQLESVLNEVKKSDNYMCRLLKNAMWNEDMVVEETIVFNGTGTEFVELIGPLLMSGKWTVNDKHAVKAFLRSLYSVFQICYDSKKEPLTLGSLENLVRNYMDEHRESRSHLGY